MSKMLEPLDPSVIKQRRGGGGTLDYVDGYYARKRPIEVFGPLGFDTQTVNVRCVYGPTQVEKQRRDGGTYQVWITVYEATVRVTARGDGTAFREGSAGGVGEDSQIGWSVHCAITEAETDATKRALMQFGDSFGLALYDKARANVQTNEERIASEAVEHILSLLSDGETDQARELASQMKPAMTREQVARLAEAFRRTQ